MDDEFQVAIDGDGVPARGSRADGPSAELTSLTLLILVLFGILLALVGFQSIESERHFFERLTQQTNREIVDLLGQQFAQSFSAASGLVEDLSRFPSVRRAMAADAPGSDPGTGQLLRIVANRNPVFRALSLVAPDGRSRHRAIGVNVTGPRPFPAELRARLLAREKPSLLGPQYLGGSGELCVGFAAAVEGPGGGEVVGTVEAEISLAFLKKLVDSVQLGRTGKVLVVAPARAGGEGRARGGDVVFSSRGFTPAQVDDFRAHFPATRAFRAQGGVLEYGPPGDPRKYLASFRTARSITHKGLDAELLLTRSTFMPHFTSTLRPDEIPDWMIVVQQDYLEGTALANRMRVNIFLLVAIGFVGLLVITRLWWDSIPR